MKEITTIFGLALLGLFVIAVGFAAVATVLYPVVLYLEWLYP